MVRWCWVNYTIEIFQVLSLRNNRPSYIDYHHFAGVVGWCDGAG